MNSHQNPPPDLIFCMPWAPGPKINQKNKDLIKKRMTLKTKAQQAWGPLFGPPAFRSQDITRT